MAAYELSIQSEFSAAHRLRLHDGHFEPLHGHNWRVEATYRATELDAAGMGADFVVLKAQLAETLRTLHDTYLNEHPAFAKINPSTEHVARYIFEQLERHVPAGVRLARVRVWEAAGCSASFARDERLMPGARLDDKS